jgi:uncharacterized protein (DUF2062 family)
MTVEGAPKGSLLRRFFRWLNPKDAWRAARRDRVGREAFAAALALGAFVGNLPTYGLHAVIGLYAAKRLHLHPLAVFLGTKISTPPVGPILNAVAIAIGHVVLHGSLPSTEAYDFRVMGIWHVLRRMLLEWMIGWPIVGLGCAAVVFMLSNRLLRLAAARQQPSDPDTAQAAEDHPTAQASGHAA